LGKREKAMARAHVLICTKAGQQVPVAEALEKIKGVVGVDIVSGGFDLYVKIEDGDADAIGTIVIKKIQKVRGVERTQTLNVVRLADEILEEADRASGR